MARPTHPIDEPDRPNQDLPGRRPGAHPDQELPDSEKPKGRASAREVSAPATTLAALLPLSAAIGDPDFMVRAVGTGFTQTSVIVFAGQEEPTNFVSDEELTTGVDMTVWLGPDPAIQVLVRTDGVDSNVLLFAFNPPRDVPLDPAYASQPTPTVNLI